MKYKVGDKVNIKTKDEVYEGITMPSHEDKIIIKLNSGYNLGIDKNKISELKVIEAYSKPKSKRISNLKENSSLPNILILHTGGTIASKVDYRTGGVVARYSPEEIIELYPELKLLANIKAKLVSNILSENLNFKHIEKIGNSILEEYKKKKNLKGIIVTHGTDVMHYTTSALAFMLNNIPIPVIVVGAQRSSDRGSSDALMNLICAVRFIKDANFKGVAICMHQDSEDIECNILLATKTRKMHSSRRDAFRPINEVPIGVVNYQTGLIIINNEYRNSEGDFSPKTKLDGKIGLVKTYPNMNPKIFDAFKGYNALVIEGTGLGHAPIMAVDSESKPNEKIKQAIKKLIDNGTMVVMGTQTIYGSVQMNVYSCGRELIDLGVKQAKMLPETAVMKLSYLFGNYKSKEEIEKLFDKNLVGELFDRIEEDTFLI